MRAGGMLCDADADLQAHDGRADRQTLPPEKTTPRQGNTWGRKSGAEREGTSRR